MQESSIIRISGPGLSSSEFTSLSWDDLAHMYGRGLALRHLSNEKQASLEVREGRIAGDALSLAPSFDYLSLLLKREVFCLLDIAEVCSTDPRLLFDLSQMFDLDEKSRLLDQLSSDIRLWLRESVIGHSRSQVVISAGQAVESLSKNLFLSIAKGGERAQGAREVGKTYPTGKLGRSQGYPLLAVIEPTVDPSLLEQNEGEKQLHAVWEARLLSLKWNGLVAAVRALREIDPLREQARIGEDEGQ